MFNVSNITQKRSIKKPINQTNLENLSKKQ